MVAVGRSTGNGSRLHGGIQLPYSGTTDPTARAIGVVFSYVDAANFIYVTDLRASAHRRRSAEGDTNRWATPHCPGV